MTDLIQARASAADVDGARIHFFVAGPDDGPVLLLIHGYPGAKWLVR